MSIFLKTGSTISVEKDSDLVIFTELPAGTYSVHQTPQGQFYLSTVDDFEITGKMYGDTAKRTQRILNTFKDRGSNTGVMLTGAKGSGKTLLAKNISIELRKIGIPTILVAASYSGQKFNEFIQSISQPVMIFFDEFEKVYNRDAQEQILTLLDGTAGGKKMYVMTCNSKFKLTEYFDNRPGRFYYRFEYSGLDEQFIREYCEDNLNDKNQIGSLVAAAKSFDEFTFDILQAMVEEMNRYNETVGEVLNYLNASPASSKVEYRVINFNMSEDYKGLVPLQNKVNSGYRVNIFADEFYIYLAKPEDGTYSDHDDIELVASEDTKEDEYMYFNVDNIVGIKDGVVTLSKNGCSFEIAPVSKESFNFGKFYQ